MTVQYKPREGINWAGWGWGGVISVNIQPWDDCSIQAKGKNKLGEVGVGSLV